MLCTYILESLQLYFKSMATAAIVDQNHFLTSRITVIWIRIYIYVETVCGIDRSPYALRHEGIVCRGRIAFENWSKLEIGYPVSSLICKLQEICGIGLARQQRQHPPFYSLVHRTCMRVSYVFVYVCIPFSISIWSPLLLSVFSLLFILRVQFLFEKPNNLSGNALCVIGALFPICISIYCFSIYCLRSFFLFLSFSFFP